MAVLVYANHLAPGANRLMVGKIERSMDELDLQHSICGARTMGDVIRGWVQYAPTRSTVGGKNKLDMSYGGLAALMDHIARQLT